jgi:hypothetical protein
MAGCCSNRPSIKTSGSSIKKHVDNLKSSIFCGPKGFLTFNLAFMSYLLYGHKLDSYAKRSKFAMKRNLIPFIEMPIIFCVGIAMAIDPMQCILMCPILMVTTCFIVRTLNLRERLFTVGQKLLGWTEYTNSTIKKTLSSDDSLCYPVLQNGYIRFSYPEGDPEIPGSSTLLLPIRIILQFIQSGILLTLAVVELLETVPSFFVDLLFDRSFISTKSNLQKSAYLAYASIGNLVTPNTQFDQDVNAFIGIPGKQNCCSGK